MLILTKALLSDSYWGWNQIGHTKYLATRNFNSAQLDIQSRRRIIQTIPCSPPPSRAFAGPSPLSKVKCPVLYDAEISIGCVCLRQISAKFPLQTLIFKIKGWIR